MVLGWSSEFPAAWGVVLSPRQDCGEESLGR